MHLPWQRKLHNKIKPPYVRLSSSWHKGRFKHVCLHFQNNLNCLQLYFSNIEKTHPCSMICGTGWKPDIWTGDKKTKSNPLWMVVGLLGFSYGRSSKLSLDDRHPSVVLWHSCQFVSQTQTDFTKHKSNHFQMEQKKNYLILFHIISKKRLLILEFEGAFIEILFFVLLLELSKVYN